MTEVQYIYEMRHSPHVMKIKEVLFDDTDVNIVMEYAECGTLCQYIKDKQKQLKEDEIKNIIKQILTAVNDMHQRGIYHRDLKP
jgi:serine/threonine protein kinase